jgi:hypothetical protein
MTDTLKVLFWPISDQSGPYWYKVCGNDYVLHDPVNNRRERVILIQALWWTVPDSNR